jgi:hypothetical protein
MEVAMPEQESAVLIEKLRRANRLWKTAAIGLTLVLTMLAVNSFWRAKLAAQRAEAYRAVAAENKVRHELGKQVEKAKQEAEKGRRQ